MANRPPRFPEFDYTGQHRYFLTICADNRAPVFADFDVGHHVIAQFLLHAAAFGFDVIAYCAMPDHFHGLVLGETDNCLLKPYLHRWKQDTGYWWKRQRHTSRLWQEGYHDRILRECDPTEAVVRYIITNPLRAGLVDDVRKYPLLGSARYDLDTLLESSFFWEPPWK